MSDLDRLKVQTKLVRRALAEKRLLDPRMGVPELDELDQDKLMHGRTFADEQEVILPKRVIVAVATDLTKKSVMVYTNRPYARLDLNRIAKALPDEIPIVFISLNVGHQGSDTSVIDLKPPVLRDGRICCGTSISVGNDRGAGTLGALVRDQSGTLLGLSCSHVIAGCGYMQVGMPIVAPWVADVTPARGWPDPRVIGHFKSSLPLIAGDPDTIGAIDNVDAATFSIVNEGMVSSFQGERYDTPTKLYRLKAADQGKLEKEKVGRSTDFTQGLVQTWFEHPLEVSFRVTCYPDIGQVKKFEATVFSSGLWLIVPNFGLFAAPGDSGALVVKRTVHDEKRRAVGIIVAGTNDGKALMVPIKPVLDALKVQLVDGL